jgi:hypothetical protein
MLKHVLLKLFFSIMYVMLKYLLLKLFFSKMYVKIHAPEVVFQ